MGNRISQVENGINTSYTYNAVNELKTSTGTTYTYDRRGNLVQKVAGADTWVYTYDPANRLKEVKKNSTVLGTYSYDANGIRAKKVEGGQTTHYLALGHKNLYEKTGNVATKHIFAGSQRIAEVKDGVVSYYHNDHLGSSRAVTNASGVLIAAMATTPFGVPHSTTAPTAYRFTGKELDSTGLYYFASRYYDGNSGRFISQDTWQGTLCTPESQNRYVYVINNPLRYVDPTGRNYLLFAEESAGGGAAVGGGADGTGTNSPGARTKQDDELDAKHNPEPNKGSNSSTGTISQDGGGTPQGDGGLVQKVVRAILDWLGEGARIIFNRHDDVVIISSDGTRKIRFDLNHPNPHLSPHAHVEELINGDWKGPRLYPTNVTHE